ncbi:MAG: hypothetical protein ACRDT4_23610 [Micromonosporaceae bacterium]
MYARVQVTAPVPEIPGVAPTDILGLVQAHPGFWEGWMLRQVNGPDGVFVSLWQTRRDAELASSRTAAALGPRPFRLAHDEVYEVRDALDGAGTGRDPAYAQLVWFDGPRSVAQTAADERSGRERAWPAIRNLPGLVRTIALSGRDRAMVVLTLTTDAETIDAAQRAVRSTTLLPGEDPALLGGPDRVDLCAVTAGVRAAVQAG